MGAGRNGIGPQCGCVLLCLFIGGLKLNKKNLFGSFLLLLSGFVNANVPDVAVPDHMMNLRVSGRNSNGGNSVDYNSEIAFGTQEFFLHNDYFPSNGGLLSSANALPVISIGSNFDSYRDSIYESSVSWSADLQLSYFFYIYSPRAEAVNVLVTVEAGAKKVSDWSEFLLRSNAYSQIVLGDYNWQIGTGGAATDSYLSFEEKSYSFAANAMHKAILSVGVNGNALRGEKGSIGVVSKVFFSLPSTVPEGVKIFLSPQIVNAHISSVPEPNVLEMVALGFVVIFIFLGNKSMQVGGR